MIGDVLHDKRNKLHEEAREKLSIINQTLDKTNRSGIPNNVADRLDTIAELDSTGTNFVVYLLSFISGHVFWKGLTNFFSLQGLFYLTLVTHDQRMIWMCHTWIQGRISRSATAHLMMWPQVPNGDDQTYARVWRYEFQSSLLITVHKVHY